MDSVPYSAVMVVIVFWSMNEDLVGNCYDDYRSVYNTYGNNSYQNYDTIV